MSEKFPSANETKLEVSQSEIESGLSTTWWKTVQEVIPGKLRNAPKQVLTEAELKLYQRAYKMLGVMVKEGRVEVSLRPEDDLKVEGDTVYTRSNRHQFRLISSGGEPVPGQSEGKLVLDS
jgi:hypothetical protein